MTTANKKIIGETSAMQIPNMCLMFGKHWYAFPCLMLLCILA